MKFLCKISFVLQFLLAFTLEAKVNIFAHYFGQPEFIKYQYLFFKKNMLDDYDFVVFEDSFDPEVSAVIKSECERYGITYIHIPKSVFEKPQFLSGSFNVDITAPSVGCAVATQYIYDHYIAPSENLTLLLDNDIFLLSPFSLENYLGSHAFAYNEQIRGNEIACVDYMLPNFVIFRPPSMPDKGRLDFNLGTVLGNNTDSGGFSHFYLREFRHLGKKIPKYYLFDNDSPLKKKYLSLCPYLFTSEDWSSHCFIEKDLFLHIRMGSNWSKHAQYGHMRQEIETLFEALLK